MSRPRVVSEIARHRQRLDLEMTEQTTDDLDFTDYEEREPSTNERLTEIAHRIQEAQDRVGWAPQSGSEFEEATARAVVEYGRAVRDLVNIVRTLLPRAQS